MPGGPALVEAPRRSTHTRARHPTTTAEVVPLQRSNTGNGGGGTARIPLLRPMKVSERVFIGAFPRPSAPRSDTCAGCYIAMYDFLKRDWTPTHGLILRALAFTSCATPSSPHGRNMASNADAAAPSGDAARTVTRKFPRDAVVVINVLRSMVSTHDFPSGSHEPSFPIAPIPSHVPADTRR